MKNFVLFTFAARIACVLASCTTSMSLPPRPDFNTDPANDG